MRINFEIFDLEYSDLKTELDGLLIDEESQREAEKVVESAEQEIEESLSENNEQVFRTNPREEGEDGHSNCETVRFLEFPEGWDDSGVIRLGDGFDELSFSENEFRLNNGSKSGQAHVRLDKCSSVKAMPTNAFKKGALVNPLDSFKMYEHAAKGSFK